MSEAHIVLMDTIDTEKAENILSLLKEKVSDDCTHIHLAIQSPGGSVPVALALANLLLSLSCPITTYNIGNVDSAALIVFAAGTERVCSPEAMFATHPISKKVEGIQTIETLSSLIQEIEEDTRRVAEFIARQTKKEPPSTWRELMSKTHIICSEEALKIGLVHCIEEYRFIL
jgi:ATP-dependent protease ClpP protease subunit